MAKRRPLSVEAIPGVVRGNTAVRREQLSTNFVSLYINDVNVLVTPWDFRLRVGQLEGIENGEALVTVLADLRVSPAHLKRLVQVLGNQLEAYEAKIGPIPTLPD